MSATSQVYRIDKKARTLNFIAGEKSDPLSWHEMNKALFRKGGYSVLDGPGGSQ